MFLVMCPNFSEFSIEQQFKKINSEQLENNNITNFLVVIRILKSTSRNRKIDSFL